MINPFFKNNGPFLINELLQLSNIKNIDIIKRIKIADIKDIVSATENTITFFHSKKYEVLASKTKASFCITTKNLSNILPMNCEPIIVENVLISTAMVTKTFYPDSIIDDFDQKAENIEKKLLVVANLVPSSMRMWYEKKIGSGTNTHSRCSIRMSNVSPAVTCLSGYEYCTLPLSLRRRRGGEGEAPQHHHNSI